MQNKEFYDVIIVGGGPCGLTAGLYAMRAAMRTVLIEKNVPGGQIAISKGVENYPGFGEISGFDLAEKMLDQAKRYGLAIMQEEVAEIQTASDRHIVRLADGGSIESLAIIIATGGNARKLEIPGEMENFGRGVSYCATCDGFFFKDRPVLVVGGGDTAVEEALYLSKIASQVYLVHRRDTFRASKILQQRIMADPKIEIILSSVVQEIKSNHEGVTGAVLQDMHSKRTRELSVEGVFIFIGFVPNNGLIPAGVRLNEQGYVITDDKCETSIAGLFVAGDLRQKYANQIVIAAADGCTAALAAARHVEIKKSSALLQNLKLSA